jgi:hypothetical protein
MFTLPSHTSHALQPLNLTCFKPFKIAFKKIRQYYFGCMGGQGLGPITHKAKHEIWI